MFNGTPFDLVALREVVEPTESRDPRKTPDSTFHYIDIASVSNSTFSINDSKRILGSDAPSRARKVIRHNDVICATTRPYLKSFALVPQDLDGHVCSTGFCVLRANRQVLPEWIFYCATSDEFLSQVLPKMRGATYPAVTDKDFFDAEIPLPSIMEQRRIVARIKECLERVEEIERHDQVISSELTELFPSLLHEKFLELSDDVPIETLEEVSEIKGGSSLPKGITQDLDGKSILLVKVGDMNEPGNERAIEVSRSYLPANETGKKPIEVGAVIFPKRGGAIATNKKRMLSRPAMIDPNLMAVIAISEKMRTKFLYYWIQTLDLTQISNGGVIPQLNRKDLAPLEIPVPELAIQDAIIDELEESEASCFELRDTFQLLQSERLLIREAVLRKAFAGEL